MVECLSVIHMSKIIFLILFVGHVFMITCSLIMLGVFRSVLEVIINNNTSH